MDIRDLKYFLAVAREESVSKAAVALHITQPPLSRQLKELEEELGKQLFIRGSKKITLTQEGLLLRKRAIELIELMQLTKAEIKAECDDVSGDVFIGCAETDALRILIRIMKAMQQDYPQVHFHLSSGNASDIQEKLDRGLIDFGIFIEPANVQKYDFLKLPIFDTWGVLMRKDSELATHATITLQQLTQLPVIFTNQERTNQKFATFFGEKFNELKIVATYNLPYVASLMVEEGIGYALILDKIIPTPMDGKLCFRPLQPTLNVNITVAWKKYQTFAKASAVFLQRLQQTLATDA